MELGGVLCDPEACGDRLVGEAFGQETQHLGLARGEELISGAGVDRAWRQRGRRHAEDDEAFCRRSGRGEKPGPIHFAPQQRTRPRQPCLRGGLLFRDKGDNRRECACVVGEAVERGGGLKAKIPDDHVG